MQKELLTRMRQLRAAWKTEKARRSEIELEHARCHAAYVKDLIQSQKVWEMEMADYQNETEKGYLPAYVP